MPANQTPHTLSPAEEIRAELAVKRARIQALLAERNLAGLLMSRHENIAWFSAGQAEVRVGLLRETGIASLLITRDDRVFYLTTNNEAPRLAAEEFAQLDFTPVIQPWYEADPLAAIRSIVSSGTVATDAPLGDLPVLSLSPQRAELTAGEITRYRWLGRHVADTASEILLALQPGISEREIQAMLAQRLIAQSILPAVYLDATDARARTYRHPVPRAGVLERFGMLCFCARRWGLSISITRFVHFGPMPAELADKFAAVAEVNARLLAATRVGATGDELFHVAREAYAAAGYPGEETMHHQGGATGYLEREWVARPGSTLTASPPRRPSPGTPTSRAPRLRTPSSSRTTESNASPPHPIYPSSPPGATTPQASSSAESGPVTLPSSRSRPYCALCHQDSPPPRTTPQFAAQFEAVQSGLPQ